jgi:predicted nicotinamide N-methyase
MASPCRAFVLRHTALRPVPALPGISIHLTDDVLAVWHALQVETGDPEAALPYWAVAWGGGQAVARHLQEHPEVVAGRRVYDLAAGSGLVAIAAAHAGAARVEANDVDPFAAAAIALNARANRSRIDVSLRDALDDPPPDADVVLTGDAWYSAELADRVLPWLRRVSAAGIDILVGDPGRAYLPTDELEEVATYDVRTTSDLEDLRFTDARVFRLRPAP